MATAPEPSQTTGPKPRPRRVGLGVILASVAVLLFAVAMLAVRSGPAFAQMMLADAYALPMDDTMTLDAGTWVVFERTGHQEQSGPVTFTTNHATGLTPDQVSVTDAAGEPVPTSRVTSTQTVNRNGTLYTGAVTFEAANEGRYHVTVSGARGEVLVARDLMSLFASSVVWFLLIALALAGCAVGVVLVVRRRRQRAPGHRPQGNGRSASPTAPPGWYPNPRRPEELLWWDGSQWQTPEGHGPAAPTPGSPT